MTVNLVVTDQRKHRGFNADHVVAWGLRNDGSLKLVFDVTANQIPVLEIYEGPEAEGVLKYLERGAYCVPMWEKEK